MALINQPPTTPPDNSGGWAAFFNAVFNLLQALTLSGTTAQRPTKFLFPGRPYFDTSLAANGRPIWVNKNGTGWVFADGTAA